LIDFSGRTIFQFFEANGAPWLGVSITQGLITTLRERPARERRKDEAIESLIEKIMGIGRHCAALPLLNGRSPDESIGYDKHGLPQ
jgi:antitoxin VapB